MIPSTIRSRSEPPRFYANDPFNRLKNARAHAMVRGLEMVASIEEGLSK